MSRTALLVLVSLGGTALADTLPAVRPLPIASNRALPTGSTTLHVDPASGDDTADGSAARPWKTLQHAAKKLRAGSVLVLRGGIYREHVTLTAQGTVTAPITIRSAPGELAIIDGSLAEFSQQAAAAWEPVEGGAPGEFRSTRTYAPATKAGADERGVWLVGHFERSMTPLHGYKFDVDLRSTNEYWNVENVKPGAGVYVGPGIWFDRASGRIHVRLAHTMLKTQVSGNYKGETDPRKVPLLIALDRTPLRIEGAKHLRLQDLVVRGSATRTVEIRGSSRIELDGVTIYGGSPALFVQSTEHFVLVRSVLRGLAAPWSSRASMKYRGNSPYLFIASSKAPQSKNWEIAHNEFTDGHDGLVLDSIRTLRFHHNLVDNFNDDGLYLTFPPREFVPEDVHVFENMFTRTYSALAFAEDRGAKNPIGAGIHVFRNVFDLRVGIYGWIAKDAATDEKPLALLASRLCGDHGTPMWDPLFFYNNTVVTAVPAWRSYYGALIGVMGVTGSKRRVFNNIFVQMDGDVGLSFQAVKPGDDLQVDGNLLWSVKRGARSDFFAKFRGSPIFTASKKVYAPGWGANDTYADPQFVDLNGGDLRVRRTSPAIDAGIVLPKTWPDSQRSPDKKAPDLGAFPMDAPALRVGPGSAPQLQTR